MAESVEVRVPDIGDFDVVDVVEVLVAVGDRVAVDDSLITLESDKASMDVPAPAVGVVQSVALAVGDQVGEGALIVVLEVAQANSAAPETAEQVQSEREVPASASSLPTPSASAPAGQGARAYDTDLLVLGSGPGGYAAAFRAADLGLTVTLVERYPVLGGVCLNVGCIPSKALLHAARVVDEAQAFAAHGVGFGEPKLDLDKLRAWKQSVVERLVSGLSQLAKRRKVKVVQGYGRFRSDHEIAVEGPDGSETISFGSAVIAVGSRSIQIPGIPWDDARVMDSTGALELADVPERLLVIGGGIIGLEMATVYEALGSSITVVELLDQLMPGCDPDLVRPLRRRLEPRYEAIYLGTRVTEIKAETEGLRAFLEGPEAPASALFDRALVAVGRAPNGKLIDAEKAGVVVDERGFIAADAQQRTNVPHIFAIGDVSRQPMLAHKATHEGKVAAEVAAGHKSGFDARVIPSVAYTDPEVAWVGLTELEAKDQGIAYGKGVFPWAASGRALALGRDEGLTKLLFDPESDRLLGAGIVGPSAGDLIAETTLAIEMGADAADLALTIHPHPTLSETIGFAAEAYEGTITDLYLPKRRGNK